jgi:hypothetical protein
MKDLDLHEIKRLRDLKWKWREIARLLDAHPETIRRHADPNFADFVRMRERRHAVRRRAGTRLHDITSLNLFLGKSPRASEDILKNRDERLSAPFRDLTGFLLGDPRRGMSALDRKLEQRT